MDLLFAGRTPKIETDREKRRLRQFAVVFMVLRRRLWYDEMRCSGALGTFGPARRLFRTGQVPL